MARARGSLRVEDFGPTIEPREVSGEACVEVADALALTLALSIDPNASIRIARRAPTAVAEPTAALPHPIVAATSPKPPAQSPAQPQRAIGSIAVATPPASTTFALGAAVSTLFSSLSPMVGAKLFAEFAWGGPRTRVALRVQSAALTNLSTARPIGTQLYSLGVGGAYLVQYAPFCLGPTARVETGVLAASGRSFTMSRDATSLWTAGSVGFRIDFDLARWVTLSAEPTLLLPLSRVRFLEERTRAQVAELTGIAMEVSVGAMFTF
jgi:hypothetical protein